MLHNDGRKFEEGIFLFRVTYIIELNILITSNLMTICTYNLDFIIFLKLIKLLIKILNRLLLIVRKASLCEIKLYFQTKVLINLKTV